jgi:6-phosphogluconolactonase (cycloisomerase 2 family)
LLPDYIAFERLCDGPAIWRRSHARQGEAMPINALRTLTGPIVLSVLLLAFAGCGSQDHHLLCQPPCQIGPGAEFLYATTNSGQILNMTLAQQTGALGPASSTPGPAQSLGLTASGFQYLYVSDFLNSRINGYSINPTSGALTAIVGSPFSTGLLSLPAGLAATQIGNFLYVSDVDKVDAYAINSATGIPTAVPGSPFVSASSIQVAVNPSGKFLFATDADPPGAVLAFTIDSTTGALTAAPGSPFPVPGQTVANSLPFGIVTDGSYVYAALSPANQIAVWSIDQTTAALTPVPGSPFSTGNTPSTLALGNNVLFAMNSGDRTISAYTVNSTTGVLSAVNGSPFAAMGASAGMAMDSVRFHLYAAAPASSSIVGFTIGSDGSLTPITGSPFPAPGAALLTIVQMPGRGG